MSTELTEVPRIAIPFHEPEFLADPYPVFDALVDAGPIHYDEHIGQYVVTGYLECARILGDPITFDSDKLLLEKVMGGVTMEAMDNPRHDQVKGIWAPAFRRRALESRGQMISEIVARSVDPYVERLRDGEIADAITGMTRAIPTTVIATMLGIPTEDVPQFTAWSDTAVNLIEGYTDHSPAGAAKIAAGEAATNALNDYLRSRVADRRAQAARDGSDLVSQMVHHPAAATMTEREIVASNAQLVLAGNETTAKLMSLTLIALAMHPDQRALLVRDRTLIPAAIEEVNRWHSVINALWRFVKPASAAVAGVELPAGSAIMCLLGGANRDPSRWENARAFDVTRPELGHLGFGFGLHSCLGINLSRLETRIWLDRLLDHLPEWELAGEPVFGSNWGMRGPSLLPLAAA
jgi:cytochrome P450